MSRPLVSVLLPVYNCERFLEAAIRSVLQQSLPDFELLVLNDGSKDRSREIAERVAKGDDRVHVLSFDNRGIVRTLNDGLERSRGELIARMDADDLALPLRFERQVAYLASHSDVVALGTHAVMIDPDGDPICPWVVQLESHEEIDRRLLGKTGGGTIVHPTVMIRRDVLVAVGGYRIECQWAEDLDLFLRLAEVGRLANLPDILLQYRQHFSSVGVTRRNEQRAAAQRSVDDAWQRRGLAGHAPEVDTGAPGRSDDYLRAWAWMALEAGNTTTARKLARRAIRSTPLNLESWRAFIFSYRGR
jgi:glycosyltransferase involved in cell wall biosynthesis